MQNDIRLIAEAVLFAADAHARGKRDDGKTPYFNHLAEVAAHCARHEPADPVLIAAAFLHDTLEDTGVSEELLRERFGAEVTETVLEVTDPPGLKGKERRQRQVDHAATSSSRAKLIKIADKTSNVAELVDHPAKDESAADMEKYLTWARAVVDVCRGVDSQMEAEFDQAAGRLEAAISARGSKKKA